jgi:hypothetical protein
MMVMSGSFSINLNKNLFFLIIFFFSGYTGENNVVAISLLLQLQLLQFPFLCNSLVATIMLLQLPLLHNPHVATPVLQLPCSQLVVSPPLHIPPLLAIPLVSTPFAPPLFSFPWLLLHLQQFISQIPLSFPWLLLHSQPSHSFTNFPSPFSRLQLHLWPSFIPQNPKLPVSLPFSKSQSFF